MEEILKSKIIQWHKEKNISITENNLLHFKRKTFDRYVKIFKRAETLSIELNTFNDINNIWKSNIVFSRLIFKYSLFFENYLESSLERFVNSGLLQTRYDNYLESLKMKTKDIVSTKGKSKKYKLNKISRETKIINNFLATKEFISIKLSDKIILYKILIKDDDEFALPIESKNLDKIRTMRNKAVHHEFILHFFINNNISIFCDLIDKEYIEQFKNEIEGIITKYNIQDLFKQDI